MGTSRHVAFCGGGSGGHLTPAIAVAESLRRIDPDIRLSFFTSSRDVDRRILNARTDANTFETLSVTALPVDSSRNRLRYLAGLTQSTLTCWRSFRRHRPDVIIGLGGFASLPGVAAGRFAGIPIALIEPNCIPGRANQRVARWAKVTFSGWPMAAPFCDNWPTDVLQTGLPARSRSSNSTPGVSAHTILVLGGSLGARSLNDMVMAAVTGEGCVPVGWRVIHQTGPADLDRVISFYAKSFPNVKVHSFIEDVPTLLTSVDFVISRAGAVSLAEIAAAGCPAILIPLNQSADDHQRQNALHYAGNGAAAIVDETSERKAEDLATTILSLCDSEDKRIAMRQAAVEHRTPDAADLIARELMKLATIS